MGCVLTQFSLTPGGILVDWWAADHTSISVWWHRQPAQFWVYGSALQCWSVKQNRGSWELRALTWTGKGISAWFPLFLLIPSKPSSNQWSLIISHIFCFTVWLINQVIYWYHTLEFRNYFHFKIIIFFFFCVWLIISTTDRPPFAHFLLETTLLHVQ